MKKQILNLSWLFVLALALPLFTQCDKNDDPVEEKKLLLVDETDGSSNMDIAVCQTSIDNLPVESLSQEEMDGILWMREEEKLARDVYLTLFTQWNAQVFENIASAEGTHFEVMRLLINRYNLTDPAAGNAAGVFTNPVIQNLYDSLTQVGSNSLVDALKVGATIEEIDILDLVDQINNIIDNQDLELIYANLLAGSRNHLRAYVKNLDRQGVTYVPQYLTQSAYDDIISEDWEQGRGNGR